MATDEEFPSGGSTIWVTPAEVKEAEAFLLATFGPEWRKFMTRSGLWRLAFRNFLPKPRQ